jgi:hypothetical protein
MSKASPSFALDGTPLLLHRGFRLSPAPSALLGDTNPEAVLELSASTHGGWKGLAELLLQRQPRRAGHQEPNGLTAPTGQGLNGAGLHPWLKGLRNRGLPHLPQLHQFSLGLNRSRIQPVAVG